MGWSEVFRVIHWGPLLALGIITEITLSGLYCLLQWHPPVTTGGILHLAIYLQWDVFILYNFFTAMYTGPGHVPLGWKPKSSADEKCLQYCSQCEGYKTPRSHHCRKCGRCVMKMDHHCPWINNCVGHRNHMTFTLFVLFAPLGCSHAAAVLIPSMYRAINRNYYIVHAVRGVPIVTLSPLAFLACVFAVSLAIGVAIAVGILFAVQIKSIISNETGIENWIRDKAAYRDRGPEEEEEFAYPYDLGRWSNFRMVCYLCGRPELTGVWWPVIEGCDQYTLTREQILQKREKAERSVRLSIQRAYSGTVCPIIAHPRAVCCPPCTDEPRIVVLPGDTVLVSRKKKHWLYGDRTPAQPTAEKQRHRGWFPRRCAIEPTKAEHFCDASQSSPEPPATPTQGQTPPQGDCSQSNGTMQAESPGTQLTQRLASMKLSSPEPGRTSEVGDVEITGNKSPSRRSARKKAE